MNEVKIGSAEKIRPEKITKPMQLLAAWLVGLFSIDSIFLVAAIAIGADSYSSAILVWASIINVPIFLIALFLLQTKFRPELQEDHYYSSYLDRKTNEIVSQKVNKYDFQQIQAKYFESIGKTEQSLIEVADDNKLNDSIQWGVNCLLGNKNEIVKTLARFGIKTYREFGKDNPPEILIAAISIHVDWKTKKMIENICVEAGIENYSEFNNIEEMTEESVLIGSYGKSEYKILSTNA